MLERTGRSGRALLTIPPKYYFSLLLITGSVVFCMIAFLTKRCLKSRSDTKEHVHKRATRRGLHRIRAFPLFQP
jgi:hypothetical protein